MVTTFLQLYAALTLSSGPNSDVIIQPEDSQITVTRISASEIDRENTFHAKHAQRLPVSAIPLKKETALMPVIEAESAIIMDFESGTILYEKNANTKMQIASITKLMTAILALENSNLEEVVTISSNASKTEGSKAWLLSGEKITMRNLLKALLIKSGNDAAIAISEHISGETRLFVEEMNKKAKDLGLYSTSFENPIGFDSPENHSTAHDVALLARYAYREEFIRNTVSIPELQITSTDGKIKHELESTNDMLNSFLNVLGLKTGHTDSAGLCFVSIIQSEHGNKIITVVLKSPERFGETKKLATWAFRSYIW